MKTEKAIFRDLPGTLSYMKNPKLHVYLVLLHVPQSKPPLFADRTKILPVTPWGTESSAQVWFYIKGYACSREIWGMVFLASFSKSWSQFASCVDIPDTVIK